MQYCLIYITTRDEAQAQQLAQILLDGHYIACANIIPNMKSLYRWQGVVQQDPECVLLLKTQKLHFSAIEQIVSQHHCYETPCIIAFDIENAKQSYLDWISETTKRA